jgi:predicted enzyme related to lactoylglutathione lyase
MELRMQVVTIDCADPRTLAAWWRGVVGGEVTLDMDGYYVVLADPTSGRPALGFQKVPEPKAGKNRVHLDLSAPDADQAAARLVDAGAVQLERHELSGFAWIVLADPEGNEFCVSRPDPVVEPSLAGPGSSTGS